MLTALDLVNAPAVMVPVKLLRSANAALVEATRLHTCIISAADSLIPSHL
jgi:hypothetical protein